MQRISEHLNLSTWQGAIDRSTHVGSARNALCGDEVWVDMEVVGGAIWQARFHGQGCMVSQACASMLCEGIEGKSIEEVLAATAEETMDFAIHELTMNRQRCALTAWEALMRALRGSQANGEMVLPRCEIDSVGDRESPVPVAEPP